MNDIIRKAGVRPMNLINDDLIDRNFNFRFKAIVYHNVTVGIEAFQKHIKDNEEFFSYNKGQALYTRLLTYAVENSFNLSAFTPKSSYSVIVGKLNEYGYNGLYVRSSEFILNISKTDKIYKLPQRSGYREKLAKCNSDLDIQMTLDTLSGKVVCDESKYALITYGYKNDMLTHLNILVPYPDYKGSLVKINVLKDISIYQNVVSEEIKEEQLSNLNKSVQEFLNNTKGDLNEA